MDNATFNGFYDRLPVKQRRGRGGTYPYVSADDVTDRMNKLFKGNWSSKVTFQDIIEGQIIIRVRVEVTDLVNGTNYYHEGFGGHTPQSSDEAGNGFKSAYSKALVNACRRWGVGLFLDEDEPVAEAAQTESKPTQLPPAPQTAPQIPNFNVPSVPAAATTTITQEKPATSEVNALPKMPKPAEFAPTQLPPAPATPAEVTQAVEKVISGMPKLPPQATTILTETVAPITPAVPPTSTPPASPTNGAAEPAASMVSDDDVSDVQKIAIQSLVDVRGFKYEDMVQGALGKTIDVNDLTHDEAVLVIQFGNQLYRESKQK